MPKAKQPPRVLRSALTGRYYVATSYDDHGDGMIQARTKHDVTEDVQGIINGVTNSLVEEVIGVVYGDQATKVIADGTITWAQILAAIETQRSQVASLGAELAEIKARDDRSLHALAAAMADFGLMDGWEQGEWDRFIDTIRLHMEPADGDALAAVKDRDQALAEAVAAKEWVEALLDVRRRATENLLKLIKPIGGSEELLQAYLAAEKTLAIPAPEALRQQQEREAEKDALIERLWAALDGVEYNLPDSDPECKCTDCSSAREARRVLSLTPPQALREQGERMASLEAGMRALEELVRLKDVQESLEGASPGSNEEQEYRERKPHAWAAAREALATINSKKEMPRA